MRNAANATNNGMAVFVSAAGRHRTAAIAVRQRHTRLPSIMSDLFDAYDCAIVLPTDTKLPVALVSETSGPSHSQPAGEHA